jgi:hypothetical protein
MISELITFCKKGFGCIKFLDNGKYELYDSNNIDEEIKGKKEKKEFLSKIKRFEI